MPSVLESLGRMTADRDDIADRYAQALDVLDGLKRGAIHLDNIQLTPQGWKVVVPAPHSAGPPTNPLEQPDFASPVDLAPPQTGPRPAELPGTPLPDAAPAREFVARQAGGTQPPYRAGQPVPTPEQGQPPQGMTGPQQPQPVFHEDR